MASTMATAAEVMALRNECLKVSKLIGQYAVLIEAGVLDSVSGGKIDTAITELGRASAIVSNASAE